MTVDTTVDRRADGLKALAEPVRWRIVERLADEELCVCHLVDDLAVTQPLVSHHLKVLRRAGLVESERFKQWVYYRLSAAAIAAIAGELTSLSKAARSATRHRRPCC
jgi:ArsR family transcriptional regulator, arsenate/arsenite/antimonite-responsive transcriptional repressor